MSRSSSARGAERGSGRAVCEGRAGESPRFRAWRDHRACHVGCVTPGAHHEISAATRGHRPASATHGATLGRCRRFAAVALSTFGLAAPLHAQTCPLYATDFGSFAGPPDFADGSYRVQWCVSGATVASSNFCPTGNALKLDGSADDPVVLIAVGDAGCTSVTVSFSYAQFAASGTVVKYGTTAATSVSCSGSTPTTLGALTATGGVCTPFTVTIPLNGAAGVFLRLDHGANTNALTIDDFTVTRTGCCGATHGCCEAGGAGCADGAVAACVCAQDPFCCATEWDAQCVAEVAKFGCGSCSGGGGGGGGGCLAGFAADFGTLYSGGSVCAKFPALFESCEGTAPFLTSSLGCASSTDMAMRFGAGFPYSAAVTRCTTLAGLAAPGLRFSYSKQGGTLGPRIDVSVDGGAWITAWTAPVAFSGGCETLLLDLTPIAGATDVRFRFASGSSVSNLATFDDLALVELPPLEHGCCETGGPGCSDATTSACACAVDAYCCEVEWDALCAAIATIYCGAACPDLPVCGSPTAGSCAVEHATPACADADCCIAVCTVDGFCCDTAWDAACVAGQRALCLAPGDIDGDGAVGPVDLAIVLNQWGDAGVPADLDASGVVDAGDLAVVLANWTG